MKLNLGCGVNKLDGYLNIDKFGDPDLKMDLEITPWQFDDNSIQEIQLNHVLEHLGADVKIFFNIIQEMYRVCKNGSKIFINVPHPRHDNFINDPTHVRVITPEVLGLFSKKNCRRWKEIRAANTPLAEYLDVDFEVQNADIIVEEMYWNALNSNQISEGDLRRLIHTQNNVVSEIRMTVNVIK